MNIHSLAQVQATQRAQMFAAAQAQNNQPVVQRLAALLRRHWQLARDAKLEIELQMMDAMRAKRGIYAPDKLARIREAGQSEIYMMLFATKARRPALIPTSRRSSTTSRISPTLDLTSQDAGDPAGHRER